MGVNKMFSEESKKKLHGYFHKNWYTKKCYITLSRWEHIIGHKIDGFQNFFFKIKIIFPETKGAFQPYYANSML